MAFGVDNGNASCATAGAATAIASGFSLNYSVVIKALSANAGDCYIGDASLTTGNGFPLKAGDSMPLSGDPLQVGATHVDLETVYFTADNVNDGIRWISQLKRP